MDVNIFCKGTHLHKGSQLASVFFLDLAKPQNSRNLKSCLFNPIVQLGLARLNFLNST